MLTGRAVAEIHGVVRDFRTQQIKGRQPRHYLEVQSEGGLYSIRLNTEAEVKQFPPDTPVHVMCAIEQEYGGLELKGAKVEKSNASEASARCLIEAGRCVRKGDVYYDGELSHREVVVAVAGGSIKIRFELAEADAYARVDVDKRYDIHGYLVLSNRMKVDFCHGNLVEHVPSKKAA